MYEVEELVFAGRATEGGAGDEVHVQRGQEGTQTHQLPLEQLLLLRILPARRR